MKLFLNRAFKTGFSDIQEDRKQVTWLFVSLSCLSVFSECSYDVSAKDTDNRVARVVTTSTGSELRPQLGGAAIDFVVMWLEAPARPSFS